jgi:NADP-dependent 3-hydroxy acid dehydrogenase YdfG
VVRDAIDRFGRTDILVNNAGVSHRKTSTTNYGVNISGLCHITQRAARVMLEPGSGHFVNITTNLVNQPIAGVPAALASLTKGGLR